MLTISHIGAACSIPKDVEALHVPAAHSTAGSGAVSVAGGTAALQGGFRRGSTAEPGLHGGLGASREQCRAKATRLFKQMSSDSQHVLLGWSALIFEEQGAAFKV